MNRSKTYVNGHNTPHSSTRPSRRRTNSHIDSAIIPGRVCQPVQAYVPQRQNGQINGRFHRSRIDSAV